MKLIKLSCALLALTLSAGVYADPSSRVAFDKETRAILRAGDAVRGGELVKSEKCTKCHDGLAPGISDDTDDPNLAGQMASYNFKQLLDYQRKDRDVKTMTKRAKKLTIEEIADISQYYAAQPLPASSGMAVDSSIVDLVYKGDPKRMLKPCATCHGRNGEGGKHDSAALMGQRRGYFITSMEEFRDVDRTNDIYSRMRLIAEVLTDEEIEGLANYYTATDPADDEEEE